MLSIGEFSKISNVTTKALRYYDEIGLIKPVRVNTENGYRYYDTAQLKTILLINKLKLYMFSLEEISEILSSLPDKEKLCTLIKQKKNSINENLNNFQYILNLIDNDISNLERGIHIMSYLDDIAVNLIETEPKNILFIRQNMSLNDYAKNIGKLYEIIAKEKLTISGAPMAIYHDTEFNPECSDTEIAVPINEIVQGTRELPGGFCAKGVLKGPYSQLTSVYAKIKQWVDNEGYTIAAPPYDVYLNDPARGMAAEEYITEVYFPTKK